MLPSYNNMIENQLRAAGIQQQWIIDSFDKIRRNKFVPSTYQNFAFADTMIPIKDERIMFSPLLQARILQSSELKKEDSVLIVGESTGYLAALFSYNCRYVTIAECDHKLIKTIQKNLCENNIRNYRIIETQKLLQSKNYLTDLSYDVIVFTGSVLEIPTDFFEHISIGGRMIIFLGKSSFMHLLRISKITTDYYENTQLFQTSIPPLVSTNIQNSFNF